VEVEMRKEFQEELADLINCHSIENQVNLPDYLLAEILCGIIDGIGPSMRKHMDQYEVDGPWYILFGHDAEYIGRTMSKDKARAHWQKCANDIMGKGYVGIITDKTFGHVWSHMNWASMDTWK
jgi:hypothetical protein